MSAIRITDKAAEHIQALLANKDGAVGIRLGTSTHGCSGLGYTVDYVEEPSADDELFVPS